MVGSQRAPDCRLLAISPASTNSPVALSSVFWSAYKPRGMSPRVSDSAHGSIVWRHPRHHVRQPRCLRTFVTSFLQISGHNPGLTWLLLNVPAPFGSGFRISTNSQPKFGGVLLRTAHGISGHG